jgi:hypothetical protein
MDIAGRYGVHAGSVEGLPKVDLACTGAGMPVITPGALRRGDGVLSGQQCSRTLEPDPVSSAYAKSRPYHHLTLDSAERAVTRTAPTRPVPVRYMSVAQGPALP